MAMSMLPARVSSSSWLRVAAPAALLFSVAGVTDAASLSSCGGSSDLLRGAKFEISPDPIERGSPFTVTVTGDLASPLANGTVAIDLDAKVVVFGQTLLDDQISEKVEFSLAPALEAGETRLVVGPVALPGEVPGSSDVTGKVVVTDGAGAPVTCVQLDLHLVLSAQSTEEASFERKAVTDSTLFEVSNCGKSGDHLQNIRVGRRRGVLTAQATLDEDVTKMSFDADLKIKYGFFKVPVHLELPVEFSPGLKKGPIKVTVSEASGSENVEVRSQNRLHSDAEVTGTVTWKDGADEEVACLSLDESESQAEVEALATLVVV